MRQPWPSGRRAAAVVGASPRGGAGGGRRPRGRHAGTSAGDSARSSYRPRRSRRRRFASRGGGFERRHRNHLMSTLWNRGSDQTGGATAVAYSACTCYFSPPPSSPELRALKPSLFCLLACWATAARRAGCVSRARGDDADDGRVVARERLPLLQLVRDAAGASRRSASSGGAPPSCSRAWPSRTAESTRAASAHSASAGARSTDAFPPPPRVEGPLVDVLGVGLALLPLGAPPRPRWRAGGPTCRTPPRAREATRCARPRRRARASRRSGSPFHQPSAHSSPSVLLVPQARLGAHRDERRVVGEARRRRDDLVKVRRASDANAERVRGDVALPPQPEGNERDRRSSSPASGRRDRRARLVQRAALVDGRDDEDAHVARGRERDAARVALPASAVGTARGVVVPKEVPVQVDVVELVGLKSCAHSRCTGACRASRSR